MSVTPRALTTSLSLLGLALAGILVHSAAHADDAAESCWTDLDTAQVQCFDATIDPIDYIEEATGDTVVAQPSGAPASAVSPLAAGDVLLLATVYDSTGFGTPSMSYTTTSSPACGSQHNFSDLGSWSNRIESFKAFNGCEVVLYDGTSFSTLIYGPSTSSTNLSSANNLASSMIIG